MMIPLLFFFSLYFSTWIVSLLVLGVEFCFSFVFNFAHLVDYTIRRALFPFYHCTVINVSVVLCIVTCISNGLSCLICLKIIDVCRQFIVCFHCNKTCAKLSMEMCLLLYAVRVYKYEVRGFAHPQYISYCAWRKD